MEVVGFGESPFDCWLRRHLLQVLRLESEAGLVLCWGCEPPADTKAAVYIPRDASFLSKSTRLGEWCTSIPPGRMALQNTALPVACLDTDLLSWVGWLVSRAEEYEAFAPDDHGRLPRSASLLEALGLGHQPVADLLIMRIREALEQVA